MSVLMPLHSRQAVVVSREGSRWVGEVVHSASLAVSAPVAVVVTDPFESPGLVRGQWFVVPRADVVPVFKPGRWSR